MLPKANRRIFSRSRLPLITTQQRPPESLKPCPSHAPASSSQIANSPFQTRAVSASRKPRLLSRARRDGGKLMSASKRADSGNACPFVAHGRDSQCKALIKPTPPQPLPTKNGDPSRARTCDRPLRRRMLYPAELLGRSKVNSQYNRIRLVPIAETTALRRG
jgi:hypothetical protein